MDQPLFESVLSSYILVAGNGPVAMQSAIDSYHRQAALHLQAAAHRELIILDDSPSESSATGLPGVRYLQIPRGLSPEEKLQYGVSQSRGQAILAWEGEAWIEISRAELSRTQLSGTEHSGAEHSGAEQAVALASAEPLVSCIMPTANRRQFLPLAIGNFQRQDYPHRELLIIDDGEEPVADLIPQDPSIRYIRMPGASTVGAKRNFACSQARGELIAHWDDDDWMAPWRLRYQVTELLQNAADICGLSRLYFWAPHSGEAWDYVYPPEAPAWLAGGTMLYSRSLWAKNPFPDVSVGEDNFFVWSETSKKILALEDSRFYVATVHPGNTSPKYVDSDRWHPVPTALIGEVMGSDFETYEKLPPIVSSGPPGDPRALIPKISLARLSSGAFVSCIMATANRPQFLRQAIRYFLRQSYTNAELVVVDHSSAAAALCAGLPCVRFVQAPESASLGARLNLGAEASRGTILQKLDDDDFYHHSFLRCAVSALEGSDPAHTVAAWDCFHVLFAGETRLRHSGHGWAAGGTLCFHREVWRKTPYRDLPREVDRWFLADSRADVRRVCAPELYVLVRHGRNTWNRMQDGGPVDDYLESLPLTATSMLDLVEPIDRPFYGEILRSGAARV